ncbi:3-isopropylmalate dehydratase large subunit [bacterium]|nr:3-isopropylmalate dehydratase large subunit [bacterium]
MTIGEKILARAAGLKTVASGDIILAKLDLCMGNDITAPLAIQAFYKNGGKKVFDRKKVALVPDHFTPNKDIKSAEQAKILREFAREQKLLYYWDQGTCGVEHALLPEQGVVVSGDLMIGADSHTCTYGALGSFSTGVGSTDLAAAMLIGKAWFKVPPTIKLVFSGKLLKDVTAKDMILTAIGRLGVDGATYRVLEMSGSAIEALSMEGRLTMSNMAIEAGAVTGLIVPDKITRDYVNKRAQRKPRYYTSDPNAEYEQIEVFDVSQMTPVVAKPSLPSNVVPVSKVRSVVLDQAVIGSCTNGRIEDMREAAKLLKGRKVSPRVRTLIIPATPGIWQQANDEGLFDIFIKAGCIVSPPTCGPCLGGHMGILAKGERAVATTNRNFVGRMGHPKSEVYLASAGVAAASAIKGRLAAPWEVRGKDWQKGQKK